MYKLLTCCAQTQGNPAQYQQLLTQAQNITTWGNIPAQAELHGLGPLCYTHLQAAGVDLPQATKRALQGLVLRHRQASHIRVKTVAELLSAYQAAGIEVLLLKGAALAHLIYPRPSLRPMRDVDILVKKADVRQAQSLLTELGFYAPSLEIDAPLPTKHLTAATRQIEGFQVSVEVHHNLFHDDYPVSMTMADLSTAPQSFDLSTTQKAYTLGYEDMLWHLCHHISNIAYPFRLIWLADIVGFAEAFVLDIDWQFIQQQYPRVMHILALFHGMTPLSDKLQNHAGITVGQQPQCIGLEFSGWPRYNMTQLRPLGYGHIVGQTFFPSEWWLRLYYGAGGGLSLWWHRWVRHPLHILSLMRQVL